MLGYISGIIKDRQSKDQVNELLVLAGGPNTGLGYTVKTPDHPRYDLFQPGQSAEIYIYTHVREDVLDLYGFLSPAEKHFFLTLLMVSGVGPKMALSILSHADHETLMDLILNGDKESLTQVQGVGKKTAERMILELKDPIQKKIESGVFVSKPKSSAAHSGRSESTVARTHPLFIEAYLALQGLGYKEVQAKQMVELALKKLTQQNQTPPPVEDVIKQALQG
jgi:Holliday junction DNA helicase RuvA